MADKDEHHNDDHDEHLSKLQTHTVEHIKEVHHKDEKWSWGTTNVDLSRLSCGAFRSLELGKGQDNGVAIYVPIENWIKFNLCFDQSWMQHNVVLIYCWLSLALKLDS